MICQTSFHRRRDPQGAMQLAEVVVAEVKRNGSPMVGELLAETVRQSCQPPNLHPHREVVPLHMRCADPIGLRISANHDRDRLHDFRGRVTLFALARSRVVLDQLRVVAAIHEHFPRRRGKPLAGC